MIRTPRSEAMAALHENVTDLYRVGLISKKTPRKFDVACLVPVRKLNSAAFRRASLKTDTRHSGTMRPK
jgi:DNA-binding transcriptional regulator YiaG